MNFEQNLKALRLSRFLTQEAVASAINVTNSTYSHYERGSRRPDIDTLFALADFYEVSVDTFFRTRETKVISDINLYAVMTHQKQDLIDCFDHLSTFSKGKLIERAKMLLEEDDLIFPKEVPTKHP